MKRAAIVILFLAAAAAGWYWWGQREVESASELTLYGNVDIRQVSLAFDGSGRIAELRAEEGDRVTAGQVIGLIDTRALELQAEAQAATVEAQRQTLLKLKNGPRPEEVAQVRAQLASAEASSVRAAQDFARASRLRSPSGGAISEQSFDQAQANLEAAKAKVEELRAALEQQREDVEAMLAEISEFERQCQEELTRRDMA